MFATAQAFHFQRPHAAFPHHHQAVAHPSDAAFKNRLILGDCIEVLSQLPAQFADLCLTDPPYGVNYQDRSGRTIANDGNKPEAMAAWLVPAFDGIYRALKANSLCVSFYGWSRTDSFFQAWKKAGFRVVGHITMPKRYSSSSRMMRYQHENAYLLAKGNPNQPNNIIPDVIDWSYSANAYHPTQKPLSVLTPLIESFSSRGGIVLDPFAGSASTCVAALSVGRAFCGIELGPKYHEAASKRLQVYQHAMLTGLAFDQ